LLMLQKRSMNRKKRITKYNKQVGGEMPCTKCNLKPQEIMPNSRKSDFIPRRRARIYDLFHLIVPKVPSD